MKIVIKANGKNFRLRFPLKMITWKIFYSNSYMNKNRKKEKACSNAADGVFNDINIDVTDNYEEDDCDDYEEDDLDEENDLEMVEGNNSDMLDAKEMRKVASAIYKELKKYKKANHKLVLVDIESATGEIVKIII